MRKFVLFLVVVLTLSLGCMAADTPRVEVFGGYSYLRVDSSLSMSGTTALNANGWDASVTGNFNRFLGMTAEFNGEYESQNFEGVNTTEHFRNMLFGPTVSYRTKKFTPFVHALFGVSHLATSTMGVSTGDNAFATAIGGGVDLKITRMLALRVAQVDYVGTRFDSDSQNHFRVASGLVVRF